MIEYIIGIGLLANGSIFLQRDLKPYDSPYHHGFLILGNLSTLITFFSGFFIINWYAPLLGALVISTSLGFIQFRIIEFIKNSTPSKGDFLLLLLAGLRNHILIISGIVISAHSLMSK